MAKCFFQRQRKTGGAEVLPRFPGHSVRSVRGRTHPPGPGLGDPKKGSPFRRPCQASHKRPPRCSQDVSIVPWFDLPSPRCFGGLRKDSAPVTVLDQDAFAPLSLRSQTLVGCHRCCPCVRTRRCTDSRSRYSGSTLVGSARWAASSKQDVGGEDHSEMRVQVQPRFWTHHRQHEPINQTRA